jgi:hypothetical protein
MTTIELKTNLHLIIDSIDNVSILAKFYFIIMNMKNVSDGDLWNSLSKEQQEELIISDTESDDENNLVPHSRILNKFKK